MRLRLRGAVGAEAAEEAAGERAAAAVAVGVVAAEEKMGMSSPASIGVEEAPTGSVADEK